MTGHNLKVVKEEGKTKITLDDIEVSARSIKLSREINEPTTATIEIYIDKVEWKENYEGDYK